MGIIVRIPELASQNRNAEEKPRSEQDAGEQPAPRRELTRERNSEMLSAGNPRSRAQVPQLRR